MHPKQEEYQKNPSLFRQEVLDDNPRWSKQIEILESVRDNQNTYVKSCHGVGKTYTAKDAVLWFLYCFYPSVVITTAPSWPQVEKLLWAEINSAHKNSKIPLGGKMLQTELKIDDNWFAFGTSPKIDSEDEGNRMAGFHSPNILIVFDEAPAVNEKLWKIKDTIMTSENAHFLAIGNPVLDSGSFFDGFKKQNVNAITMSIFDSPNFIENHVTSKDDLFEIVKMPFEDREKYLKTLKNPFKVLTNIKWAVDRVLEWGADSPMTQARVFGEFPEKTDDTIISYTSLERCKLVDPEVKHGKTLGVDVARYGTDFTVFIGYENGKQIFKRKWNGQNLVETANVIKYLIKIDRYTTIVIDDTGLGGGVTDIIQEFISIDFPYVKVIPINFASGSDTEEYDGIVTEMYFHARDLLIDQKIQTVDQDNLFAELSNRKYKYTNKGKFKIESKDDYKKRTKLSSPDEADSFVLCMWGIEQENNFVMETYGDREAVEGW